MSALATNIDLDRLFKLRLVVARHGEMDAARWWNTNGVLSRKGRLLMSRGFPKTHQFTQARLVFEVARARSAERFPTIPGCITLWHLPADVEAQFEACWPEWVDGGASWADFFESIQAPSDNLLDTLHAHELIQPEQAEQISRMRRSAEGRSVALPGERSVDDDTITLLAAAFSHGEAAKPAIPFARVDS
ncbi:hypothetical protein Thiowin_05042 [Thiorhodovibrio winogradskyi]|uniref:BrxE family protein n=1 Tax=Thiorhodovibrio winogradskyi TaxID=77007 RepID=A0ABZ0SGU7_9GAMM|nr:BrxE family protein [Thiorhodovibrio winogradskyi]